MVITALLFLLRSWHYDNLLMQQEGYYAKMRTAFLDSNRYDVLFLGSSRVEMHYDTRLFDSLTGANSFNLGMAGATPQLAWAVLKGYLEKSEKPRMLFYELDYHALKDSREIKDFNNYFPVLRNATLRHQLSRIDGRMTHFYYNPYYSWPFTGIQNLSTGLHNRLHRPNRTDSLYHKGFVKEVLRPELKYLPATPFDSHPGPVNRQYLDSLMQFCRHENIELHLVTSPMFAGGNLEVRNREAVRQELEAMAKTNGLRWSDLSSLPFCDERSLFVDHYHMNERGARKFTVLLARSLTIKPKTFR